MKINPELNFNNPEKPAEDLALKELNSAQLEELRKYIYSVRESSGVNSATERIDQIINDLKDSKKIK